MLTLSSGAGRPSTVTRQPGSYVSTRTTTPGSLSSASSRTRSAWKSRIRLVPEKLGPASSAVSGSTTSREGSNRGSIRMSRAASPSPARAVPTAYVRGRGFGTSSNRMGRASRLGYAPTA